MSDLHITFYGGVGAVTGANFLLESLHTRLLVDCGMLQGTPEAGESNAADFPYDPKTMDFLFVTHAHLDHIGKIGKLVKDGFRGTIYSTPETKDLTAIMIQDALHIMDMNQRQSGATGQELYSVEDFNIAMSLWKTIPYHAETTLSEDLSVYLKDAGHILGSAMYQFTHLPTKKKVVFTGDSGNSPSPLLRDTDPITDADYLIIDSVYGDRNHEPKDERDRRFQEIVEESIAQRGALVIPAFSLERTQVILYELNKLAELGQIPSVPVFLDSPLGLKVTDIYKRYAQDFNDGVQQEMKHDDIFSFPKLSITHGARDSHDIEKYPNPKIIIAGSGMSSGGRVVAHEAFFLPDPKSTILLMGYQALGTLGRRIQDKPSQVEIEGQIIPVRARIEMISGYSSHKDSDHLVAMAADTAKTLKKAFVVMGEPSSAAYLAQRLHNELGMEAVCPEAGKTYEL
jgi:metallo-beta-lactamase family protein